MNYDAIISQEKRHLMLIFISSLKFFLHLELLVKSADLILQLRKSIFIMREMVSDKFHKMSHKKLRIE